jgi:hypothetical protein
MKPVYWVLAAALGVAFAGAWTYLQQRDEDAPAEVARPGVPAGAMSPAAVPTDSTPMSVPATAVTPTADESVARWTADVDSTDAAKRSAAIVALAQAPRTRALPVLRRVVLNGEPAIDRPLALKSLRDLAISQGDADNGVRQVMREVLYHGDDEPLAVSAQETLDAVEQAEQKLAQR